jgi:hypothetical protein
MVPFYADLLDFASDIGEEDNEEEKLKKPLASLDPSGPEPALFDILHPNNPSLLFPVSCFMGHFLGVYLGLGGGGVFWEEIHEFGGDSTRCGAGQPNLRQKREKIVEERREGGGGATVPFARACPHRLFSSPPVSGSGETHAWVLLDPVWRQGRFGLFLGG